MSGPELRNFKTWILTDEKALRDFQRENGKPIACTAVLHCHSMLLIVNQWEAVHSSFNSTNMPYLWPYYHPEKFGKTNCLYCRSPLFFRAYRWENKRLTQLQFFAIPRCLGCYLILHRQVGTAAPFTHVGIIFSICFVGYDEQHNYTYQFLELFLIRSSLFLMSNMLSGSAVIESVVSVDCEITEGCKK